MPSQYSDRVADLADAAEADRASFDPPADPPDERRALRYCREGVGEAVAVYVAARTGEFARFEEGEFETLELAMNTYLDLYARCYGVDIDADYSARTAAEVLVDTHDIVAVAQILTGVPSGEPAGN
jgi:hypothetical protein